MDAFTRAYIETALWSSTDESRDDGGDPLDKNYCIADLSPSCRAEMVKDCADFQEAHTNSLADLDWWDEARAGHDFWLTRNRHGAGYWDGDYPEPHASELTRAAHAYGSCYLYVGDDGQIHTHG